MTGLTSISDKLLLEQAAKAVASERASTSNVIRHFQEISDRRLYLDRGFANLYEMVTKQFGYCAASAMRRINSMRLVREIPEIEEKIESGELSLTAAASVQSFFYSEAKEARPYSRGEKLELLETCLNKSSREVEMELCSRNPEREKRESVRPTSDNRFRISFSISGELNSKLEMLKALLAHGEPSMTTEALIDRLTELGLDKFDPKRAAARANKREPSLMRQTGEDRKSSSNNSPPAPEVAPRRYIKACERHKVSSSYDGSGCEFVDAVNGRRCGSKRFLQLDHIKPFSHGGGGRADNLRTVCGAHNRWLWRSRGSVVKEAGIIYRAG